MSVKRKAIVLLLLCFVTLSDARRVQVVGNVIPNPASSQALVELHQSVAFTPPAASSRATSQLARSRNGHQIPWMMAAALSRDAEGRTFDGVISELKEGIDEGNAAKNIGSSLPKQDAFEPCIDVGFWQVPAEYCDEVTKQMDGRTKLEDAQKNTTTTMIDYMKVPLLMAVLGTAKVLSQRSLPMRSAAPAMKVADDAPADSGKASLSSILLTQAQTIASLACIITFDVALRRLFRARAITFPSSLAGMMVLFAGLCTAQLVSPKVAGVFASLAAPGCGFISKWLALFFVPNMIVLPIVLQMSVSEAARVLGLVVVGLALSLPLAALTASLFLPADNTGATSGASTDSAPAAGVSVKKPWKPMLAWLVTTGSAAAMSQLGLGNGSVTSALIFCHFLVCTICGFVGGQKFVPKSAQKILHPLITCTIFTQLAIFVFAKVTAQPLYGVLRGYLAPGGAALSGPGNLLLFMLGPATLSFAFQMFSRRQLMAQSAAAVSAVTVVSSAFGLAGTALAGRLLHLSASVRLAALSRQVTAPLAIAIAGMLGTDPSIAVTITLMTGLLAANFGRAILDGIGVRSPVARGLAMGASGHGIGTAAMAEEKDAFPFAAIALALIATASTIFVSIPSFKRLLFFIAGVPIL